MWERTLGWSLEEVQQRNLDLLGELYPDPLERQRALDFIAAATGEWADFRIRVRDGRIIDATLANILLSDGTNISIGQDITERKRAEAQLKDTAQQLRALSARINSAKEDEGTRIAREIHDELGGALTTLGWDLGSLETMMTESVEPMQLLAAREKIRSMLRVTESTINVVRRIAADLRPSMLDDLGLMEAIEWRCQQFQLRTGIICRWECRLEKVDLSRDQSTAVYRILQEALTNIVRHARATRVDIRMKEEEGHIVLTVGDDGRGISEEEKSSSHALGLLGMRERAYLIRGRVEVTGVKGKGTKVTVHVPILANAP
jgi:PAS domain S-box-containing protein